MSRDALCRLDPLPRAVTHSRCRGGNVPAGRAHGWADVFGASHGAALRPAYDTRPGRHAAPWAASPAREAAKTPRDVVRASRPLRQHGPNRSPGAFHPKTRNARPPAARHDPGPLLHASRRPSRSRRGTPPGRACLAGSYPGASRPQGGSTSRDAGEGIAATLAAFRPQGPWSGPV